jgi:UDP-GlcNAc:undecaprenyl-phosphate GlcNAc-1-phosphate transferase
MITDNMSFNILLILGALFISMICGFLAIPGILDYCKEKNLYDIPNLRKVHKSPIPRLGGLSFMPSMLIAFIIAIFVLDKQGKGPNLQISLWSLYFLVSLLIIYFTGIIDDLIGLNANIKFTIQIIAATILPFSGLYINNFYGLFGLYEIPFWIGTPITIFVIVFVCNAMNLIDGIDGLCASLSEFALAGFLYIFYEEGLYIYCILIGGLMGVLIPYLYYNMLGKPENNRKIFMGDSGSLTLGFILGFLFVKCAMNNPHVMKFSNDRIMLAYSLLTIPVFDVVRVIFHRLRNHKPLFDADKNHIHHKLMRAGYSQHQALIFIMVLAFFIIVLNCLIFNYVGIMWLILIDIAFYTIFQILLTRYIIRKEKKAIV